MIDTLPALRAFLNDIPVATDPPTLYVDLEGNNLSRHGTLSLVTIMVEPRHTMHLIDVTTLKKDAFTTADEGSNTLQQILESSSITKVFFDVRRDSDALFHLFGVRVAGIQDLQLMEIATRSSAKRFLSGLAKCVEKDARLAFSEKVQWQATKNKGHRLFDPASGGSYAVLDERPLSPEMLAYCVQDVIHMPVLLDQYKAKLSDAWMVKVEQETAARIALSQSASFDPKGQRMAEAPAGWEYWRPGGA